jgi:uncharacterized protein
MATSISYRKLSISAFALEAAPLQGQSPLAQLPRLADEAVQAVAERTVHFQALGSMRSDAAGTPVPWLQLEGQVEIDLVCQRCLEPVATQVQFDREFRFVESEEAALAQDEDSEEDLLVSSSQFDLLELVEDELLMALPVSPKHEQCPGDLKLSAADADFESTSERPNPFAKLAQLKTTKS